MIWVSGLVFILIMIFHLQQKLGMELCLFSWVLNDGGYPVVCTSFGQTVVITGYVNLE